MTVRRRLSRVAVSALVASALAGTAVLVVSAPASAGRSRGTAASAGATVATDAAAASDTIPAPPRPEEERPTTRVVSAGTTNTQARFSTASLTATTTVSTAATGAGISGSSATALVLYDSTGPYAWLGEAYATLTANLVSHFGSWTAHPVSQYTSGELSGHSAVVYVGSTYDEALPLAFLDDVLSSNIPVIWIYDNIWQLTSRDSAFTSNYGFTWKQFDFSSVSEISYNGTSLTRDPVNGAGIMDTIVSDSSRATVLATAVRADGTAFPWAVRSGNLTYIGEVPYAYMTHDDRYLAFCDLLFDALAPTTVERHQALIRIEDVGPDSDPAELRAVANYLYSQRIPFTVAVYTRYRDPNGVNNDGVAEDYTLQDRPKVVRALRYMQSKGGTLLMHGYTHQYDALSNPYDGVSANDFEFYLAHVDDSDSVIYDGPVPDDSSAYVTSRVSSAAEIFSASGLGTPTIFEFPHYAGSATDYETINGLFATRYDRGLYFPGVLSGTTVDYTRIVGQFFPYPVRDVYGTTVIPENIGNVEPEAYNNHPARLPSDIVASASRNLVIRDGVASLFYHPYLGTTYLQQVVEGVQGLGYTFVSASSMTTA